MSEKTRAVVVRAEVRQIKTMVDHSINIVLNLPEDCKEQVKTLLDWQGLEIFSLLTIDELDSLIE